VGEFYLIKIIRRDGRATCWSTARTPNLCESPPIISIVHLEKRRKISPLATTAVIEGSAMAGAAGAGAPLLGLVPDVDLTVQERYAIRDRLGKGVRGVA
jgi:hypothetical protein